MEAIAMKMTQGEFDSIKDLLPKTKDHNFDLLEYPYVTNNFSNTFGDIGSTDKGLSIGYSRKVYEYFDRDIFLKACDIQVEKVWDVSEMQYQSKLTNEWIDCIGENSKFRFKPQPDYSKEIEILQNKAKENGMKAIITFEKI